MRTMRTAALAFVLSSFLLLCPLQAHAQHASQKEPVGNSISSEAIDREMLAWELAKKKDKSNLDRLLSEDFAEITEDGLFNKAGMLANLDNLTVTNYSATDFTTKNLAPNTVLLIYKVTVTGLFKGHAFQNHNYASSLWMKRDGGWQNVFFQETDLDTSDAQK
jgi:hypothetical protein